MESFTVTADDGVELHIARHGTGPAVVVLSGGPGCVHYLARAHLSPSGFQALYPDPRGVARSGGGPHDMARAVADLEDIRRAIGAKSWLVAGHSWGADLALAYALDFPGSVAGVLAIAAHGPHKDRTWSEEYHAGKATEKAIDIEYDAGVWAALNQSFAQWIHRPPLFKQLSHMKTPVHFVVAGNDIRPRWPIDQLTELIPGATCHTVPGAIHDFWYDQPETWQAVMEDGLARLGGRARS